MCEQSYVVMQMFLFQKMVCIDNNLQSLSEHLIRFSGVNVVAVFQPDVAQNVGYGCGKEEIAEC